MQWIVIGAAGMLGQDVVARLTDEGRSVEALDRADLDITDPGACDRLLRGADVVVNCAAWTAVDLAEEREAEAFAVNATGAANLARAASSVGARLVQISTDYVFDGSARTPYAADAPQNPATAYGRTKAAGEWAVAAHGAQHLIMRTAYLYGAGGVCFPRTIVRLATERGGLDVVDDQLGQPTWTVDVADLLVRAVDAEVPGGIYHATSQGSASWFEFAAEAVEAAGMDRGLVRPTTSEAFVRPAPRPAYSVLGHESLRAVGLEPIGAWQERWSEAAGSVLAASPR
ncbi:MAG: dTDP-4-dehydrorhamnose reductase [Oerskovia sp.]|jgi:dTDP-4-dehydrorhamnose reductase|nr:dTDP-4-dehydrorhamnose reductase [Oerskovia sp.]